MIDFMGGLVWTASYISLTTKCILGRVDAA